MRCGVKQDPELLFRSFAIANRFLPKKFIAIWLEHNKEMINDPKILAPDEYFYLASNTYNKTQLINEKIPKIEPKITKDKKFGIFLLEEGLSMRPDFDIKLEQIMAAIPMASIKFDYTYSPVVFTKPKYPPARKKALKLLETHSYKQFSLALKDPKLIKELKTTLTYSGAIVNKTKINSNNFSYMNFRNDRGFMTGISSIMKSTGKTFTPDLLIKPTISKKPLQSNRLRPQTSRPLSIRPMSGLAQTTERKARPQTGNPSNQSSAQTTTRRSRPQTGNSKYSSALSLGIKDEPYHILTLRESVTMSNRDLSF